MMLCYGAGLVADAKAEANTSQPGWNIKEDQMSSLSDISPVLIPVMAMLIPLAAIIAWAVIKIARLNLLHETVRQISANGQPIPPELLSEIVHSKRP